MKNSVGDLISREAAIEMLKEKLNRNYTPSFTAGDAFASALHRIKNLPSIDAVPVVHGRWVPNIREDTRAYPPYTYQNGFKCSVCGRVTRSKKEPYCHCGAKMDEKEKENEK